MVILCLTEEVSVRCLKSFLSVHLTPKNNLQLTQKVLIYFHESTVLEKIELICSQMVPSISQDHNEKIYQPKVNHAFCLLSQHTHNYLLLHCRKDDMNKKVFGKMETGSFTCS